MMTMIMWLLMFMLMLVATYAWIVYLQYKNYIKFTSKKLDEKKQKKADMEYIFYADKPMMAVWVDIEQKDDILRELLEFKDHTDMDIKAIEEHLNTLEKNSWLVDHGQCGVSVYTSSQFSFLCEVTSTKFYKFMNSKYLLFDMKESILLSKPIANGMSTITIGKKKYKMAGIMTVSSYYI